VAVRFSKDGQFCACVFAPKDKDFAEVMLYRLMDKTGNHLLPEKTARKPLRVFKVPEIKKFGQVVDLFIFSQISSTEGLQYNMYLIFDHGIMYYPAIDKRVEPVVKLPEMKNGQPIDPREQIVLKAACNSFDYKSMKLIANV
jgi:hypothetical protein